MPPKQYLAGTHRVRAPADTLRLIAPHFARVGLTRIADVTGLDRVGIPVCVAVRPNARSLSVSQGKGSDLIAAKVSAAMESIELYHAEQDTLPRIQGSYQALRASHTLCHPPRLHLDDPTAYHDALVLPWVEGVELMSQQPILVPYDLVHCSFLVAEEEPIFWVSSNGLASGNHPLEATLHGLYEVIERDATSLWELSSRLWDHPVRVISLTSVTDPLGRSLIERLQGAGLSLLLWEMTSDVALPVIGCAIWEEAGDYAMHSLGIFQGYGCHLSPAIALSRALTEAAQVRLTYIAGTRDDIFREGYQTVQSSFNRQAWLELLSRHQRPIDFGHLANRAGHTLEEDLATVLAALRAAGFAEAISVDLSQPEMDIFVARTIIPDMARPNERDSIEHSPRVERFRQHARAQGQDQ